MPSLFSKIPIGFNLDGYDFLNSSSTAPSSFNGGTASGVDAAWGGGLVDKRWVADADLKQVQFQGTHFQSVPLIYHNTSGEKEYAILSDHTGQVDNVGYKGGSTYGASIYADCSLSNTEKLTKWSNENKQYHGGSCDDFTCGVAISWVTLRDYLQHFYNLSITDQQAKNICYTHKLNVEVLYNTSASQGKAFRLRVVDSPGNSGWPGSYNHSGHFYYTYDLLDTMTAILLTKGFEDVVILRNTEYNQILNGDNLYFPWKNQTYNYKNAQIPGYSPTNLMSLGLKDMCKRVKSTQNVGWRSHYTVGPNKHPVSRGRFFVDPEFKSKILEIVPTMSDDFFSTNYSVGQIAAFSGYDISNYSSVGEAIYSKAQEVYKVILANKNMSYGRGDLKKVSTQSFPLFNTSNNLIDCDGYANWVLLECGITNNTVLHGVSAELWSPEYVNQSINPEYKAVEVPNVSDLQKGDILVYGKGKSHVGIFQQFEGSTLKQMGMGRDAYVKGTEPQPSGSWSSSYLVHMIRIVKNNV